MFLLGTAFFVNAQEMTPKEKTNYAIGMMLGEKIKESGIDMSLLHSIREKLNEKIDFESLRAGIHDNLDGQSKLSKEEIMAILAELEKQKDSIINIFNSLQNNGNEQETNKPLTGDEVYLPVLARGHGTLSWYYLFIKDYAKSEQAARMALKLDNSQTWVKTNLAHALLFRNRFSKAEKIYKELSQIIEKGTETYSQTLLDDFEQLEKAGAIPDKHKANVEKIRKMLRE
jgi:tetratricopeptide (TPR) repeat protein